MFNLLTRNYLHEKKVRQIMSLGWAIKRLTSALQNCQGCQKPVTSAKLSQSRRAKGCMMSQCEVVSWMGS